MQIINNSPYIRFLKLLESVDSFSMIDPFELSILRKLFIQWSHHEKVFVTDYMKFTHIASSATLHRKLKRLIDLNLLKLDLDSSDFRKKIILPTRKLEKDFHKLNLFFKKANF